jgi:hypothetical protein
MIAPAMSACSSPSCLAESALGARRALLDLMDELVRFERLIVDLVE